MSCQSKIAKGFIGQCGYMSKQGLERKYYINYDDIDFEATQLSTDKTKVTDLVLKENAKIYRVEAFHKTLKAKHALSVGDFGNGYIHTDSFAIAYQGVDARSEVQKLVAGAKVVSLNFRVDKGNNSELACDIFGLESGMAITEDNYDSSANSGSVQISVATREGEQESTGKKLFAPSGGLAAIEAFISENLYSA